MEERGQEVKQDCRLLAASFGSHRTGRPDLAPLISHVARNRTKQALPQPPSTQIRTVVQTRDHESSREIGKSRDRGSPLRMG